MSLDNTVPQSPARNTTGEIRPQTLAVELSAREQMALDLMAAIIVCPTLPTSLTEAALLAVKAADTLIAALNGDLIPAVRSGPPRPPTPPEGGVA